MFFYYIIFLQFFKNLSGLFDGLVIFNRNDYLLI